MKKLLILSMLIASTTSAFAANNSIFSCNTDNGNKVSVTKSDTNYEFKYGQIMFSSPVKQVLANQDSYVAVGSGFITSSLEMKNKGTSYTIQFVQPRNSKNIDEPTLYIQQGEKMDTIKCKPGTAIQNFEVRNMKSS